MTRYRHRTVELFEQITAAGYDIPILQVDFAIEDACVREHDETDFWPELSDDQVWHALLEDVLAGVELEYDDVFPVTVEPRPWRTAA